MGSRKKGTLDGRGPGSGGKGNKSLPAVCEYDVGMDEDEATMKLKCKACPGPHSVEGPCLSSLLSAFSKEYNIRKITLSHYIEKQYYGHSITLLGKITALAGEMENLSLRDPVKEYFWRKAEKDRKRIACTKCPLNPSGLFTKMHSFLMKDMGRFYSYLKAAAAKIPGFKRKTKHCNKCLQATTEDLNLTFDEYEKLAGFIAANAYGRMLSGNKNQFSWMLSPQMMEQYLSPLLGYAQNFPAANTGASYCAVCRYPLRGKETACPNCRARIVG